jgi:hypothetical protein
MSLTKVTAMIVLVVVAGIMNHVAPFTSPVQADGPGRQRLNVLLKEEQALAKEQVESWKGRTLDSLNGFASRSKRNLGRVLRKRELEALVRQLELDPTTVSASQRQVYLWAQRLLRAEAEAADTKAHRIAAYKAHLLRMNELEEQTFKGVDDLAARYKDQAKIYAAEAKFHRIEAEIMLEREKAK